MSLVDRFKTLLDSEPLEEELQKFLTENPRILLAAVARNHDAELLVKPNIHRFELDFAVSENWASTGKRDWTLIELERSTHRLFTKAGDPTAAVTHAVRQTMDWREWIQENLSYARKILPEIAPVPSSLVIIGRRDTLQADDKTRLSVYMAGLYRVTIRTYDYLLDVTSRLE